MSVVENNFVFESKEGKCDLPRLVPSGMKMVAMFHPSFARAPLSAPPQPLGVETEGRAFLNLADTETRSVHGRSTVHAEMTRLRTPVATADN
jgi:hypothetical protein